MEVRLGHRKQIQAEISAFLGHSTGPYVQSPDPIEHRDIAWFRGGAPSQAGDEVVLARALRAPLLSITDRRSPAAIFV